ncbi:MAG: response regulator [Hyphomonadaceae bacterium]
MQPLASHPGEIDVLIVDDNAHMRALLGAMLECFGGMRIRQAGCGREALELIAQAPADLLLLDYILPDMSGLDVLRDIRAAPRGAGAHIIMITGYDDPRSIDEARAAGADAFLAKPIDLAALAQRLEAVTSARI